MKVVRLSAIRTGHLYRQEIFLVLNPEGHSADGLCQWRIPMTPSGIYPATFRLVVQYLNQLRHRIPHFCIITCVWFQSTIKHYVYTYRRVVSDQFIPHPNPSSTLTDKHICVSMHFGRTESCKAECDLCDYILPWSSCFWFGHSQWLYYPTEVKVLSDYDWKFILWNRGKGCYPKTQCLDVQYFSISINYRIKRGE